MKYKDKVIKLKGKEKGYIVLVRNGAFYIAIGNDAVLLNRLLGLNCTCFAKGICKVGFPANSLEKYTKKIIEIGYKYLVYEYKDEKFDLIEARHRKAIENEEVKSNLECENCPKYKIFNF